MASSSADRTLWLYTSLSSGSSQIVTATSRLETILKANKIPFKALDVATDDKARQLWGRRAGKRKLPGLVRLGEVLADINEVEEWNEYGEIKEMLEAEDAGLASPPAPTPAAGLQTTPQPLVSTKGAEIPAALTTATKAEGASGKTAPSSPPSAMSPLAATMQAIGFEVADKASQIKEKVKSPRGKSPTSTEVSSSPIPSKEETSKPDRSADTPLPTDGSTAEASNGPTASAEITEPKVDAVPTTEAHASKKTGLDSAIQSPPLSSAVLSTDSLPRAPTGEDRKHRGSSISAASSEEIAAVEQATKIDEEPEVEEQQAVATEKDEESGVSPEAAKQDLVQEPEKPLDTEGESEGLEEKAREKKQNEPHIKFIGETPGQEIDRVKATLGGGRENKDKKADKLEKAAALAETEPTAADADAPPSSTAADTQANRPPPTISIVEASKADSGGLSSSTSGSGSGHARRVSNPPQMDLKASPTNAPTKEGIDLNLTSADPIPSLAGADLTATDGPSVVAGDAGNAGNAGTEAPKASPHTSEANAEAPLSNPQPSSAKEEVPQSSL